MRMQQEAAKFDTRVRRDFRRKVGKAFRLFVSGRETVRPEENTESIPDP